MASYYPEGECFFVRSSLSYGGNWSAENRDQFYNHVLLEYQWNGWVTSGNNLPTHPRSKAMSGTASLYNTRFVQWDRFYVGESKTTDPGSMLAITSHPNSLNWNEMRDRDRGGPRKYILRPVRIRSRDTQWLWIDATIPLRAIYFPVSQQTDEAYKQYCTYVVLDFKARETINCFNLAGEPRSLISSRESGLGLDQGLTWLFKVPDLVTYLTIPHKLRNPEYGIYSAKTRTDALFLVAWAGNSWRSNDNLAAEGFHREIDLAQVISATFGVEVGWRPYKFSSFILDLVTQVVQLGLGFIPGAGPLLSVAFGIGLQLLNDPDSFKVDNVLDFSAAVLETLISSAGKSKKYVAPGFLPGKIASSTSARMASIRMPPKTLASASEADDMITGEVESISEGDVAEKKKAGEEENAQVTARVQKERQVLELTLEEAFRRAGY